MDGPCDWGFEVEDCSAFDSLTPERQQDVIEMATEYLWNWTDRMFGVCEVTVRPCRGNCPDAGTFWGSSWSGGKMLPVLIGGVWHNMGCGACGSDDCGCSNTPTLRLPSPIVSITEIMVDGVTLDPSAYRVDNARFLIRTDGERWPTCQNMTLPPTEEGTFMITYTRGIPVPAGGRMAGAKLACEFAKAIVTPKDCSLPERIKSITRDGVQVTLMDDFKDLEGYKTGIWVIDSWVTSVMSPRRPSTVRSVDIPRPKFRRETGATPPIIDGGGF